jgi:CheY-like chemotaxis protein
MPVDMVAISEQLKDTTVFLIHNDDNDADAVYVSRILQEYQTDFARFRSCSEMEEFIVRQGVLSRDRSYICLVKEDLYVDESYHLLSSLSKSVLLTYGPKYHEIEGSQCHFGSFSHILPAVLMKSIYLQSPPDTVTKLERPPSFKSAQYHDYRVLIAEDNRVNQKVLYRMLQHMKVKNIVVVDNGLKAVDREAAEPFDIVLMDMQMPVMDGIEATKRIVARQVGDHPVASVVFVTAHASSSFEIMCEKAGGIDFLPKPFNLEQIEKCFHRVYQIRESVQEELSPDLSVHRSHVCCPAKFPVLTG